MTQDREQSEQEREDAQREEHGSASPSDAMVDEGGRHGDEDVVGDDASSPGQNSDRLPQ